VFTKDVAQFVALILQIGFWVTPVFWRIQMLPEDIRSLVLLNPVVFFLEGYRAALLYNSWIWESESAIGIYLLYASSFLIVGGYIFSKLRSHFGDVI
jgi:ABC-type polysaccharide/polyol phosphate export permease